MFFKVVSPPWNTILKCVCVLQLNTAIKVGQAERESLKEKIAELTTSLEELRQKARQVQKSLIIGYPVINNSLLCS